MRIVDNVFECPWNMIWDLKHNEVYRLKNELQEFEYWIKEIDYVSCKSYKDLYNNVTFRIYLDDPDNDLEDPWIRREMIKVMNEFHRYLAKLVQFV